MTTLVLSISHIEPTWYVKDKNNITIGMIFEHTHPPFSSERNYFTANLIGQMVTDVKDEEGHSIFYGQLEAQIALERAAG